LSIRASQKIHHSKTAHGGAIVHRNESNEFEIENCRRNESGIDPPGSKHLRQPKLKGIDCANTWKWLGESDTNFTSAAFEVAERY